MKRNGSCKSGGEVQQRTVRGGRRPKAGAGEGGEHAWLRLPSVTDELILLAWQRVCGIFTCTEC